MQTLACKDVVNCDSLPPQRMLLVLIVSGKPRHSRTTRCCLTTHWDITTAEDTMRTQEGYQVSLQLNPKLLQATDTLLGANGNTDPRLFQSREHLWEMYPIDRSISATIAPLLPHLLLHPLQPPCTQGPLFQQAHVADQFPTKLVPLYPGQKNTLGPKHREKLGGARAPEYALKMNHSNSLYRSCLHATSAAALRLVVRTM